MRTSTGARNPRGSAIPRPVHGEAQGKKVVSDGVASQTIEAQPVFGQIKPSQRPGASRAETQSWEKRWLISVMLYKRSEQLA
jgi:hypothetical protein